MVAAAEAMSNLAPLLERTVTYGGAVHELSCLVADPGAPRQCIHADTSLLPLLLFAARPCQSAPCSSPKLFALETP